MTDRENPLLKPSTLPHGVPPFDKIREEDYLPAVEAAIGEARAKLAELKKDDTPPTFASLILSMENFQDRLGDVTSIFYNQLSAVGGDGLQELAEKIGPLCADFASDIILDEELFARIKLVHDTTDLAPLTPEEQTLLTEGYKGFVRGGALLGAEAKQRLREISQRLSVLGPIFMNNVTKSADSFEMLLDNEKDIAGLPDSAREAAALAADEAGHAGKFLFTLDFPLLRPVHAIRGQPGFARENVARLRRPRLGRRLGQCAGGQGDRLPCATSARTCSATKITPPSCWRSAWPRRRATSSISSTS